MRQTTEASTACATPLRRVVARLQRRLRPPLLAPTGLSAAKLSVIGRIHHAGSLTPSDVARLEGVKLQTLTRLLAELQAEHWLQRRLQADDKRQSLLSLTPTGAKRLQQAAAAADAALAACIASALTPAEIATLAQACSVMDKLASALENPAASAPLESLP